MKESLDFIPLFFVLFGFWCVLYYLTFLAIRDACKNDETLWRISRFIFNAGLVWTGLNMLSIFYIANMKNIYGENIDSQLYHDDIFYNKIIPFWSIYVTFEFVGLLVSFST
jgi:D-alanyl-lipoteichoic acid acyltransferase DltB (MBOAT superfamily)